LLLRDIDKKAFVQKELDHFASILKSKLKRTAVLKREKADIVPGPKQDRTQLLVTHPVKTSVENKRLDVLVYCLLKPHN
jgi:hypothetical protein